MKIGDTVRLIRPYRISTSSDPLSPKSSKMTERALQDATFYWAYTLRNSKDPSEKTADRKLSFQIPRNLVFDALSQADLPNIEGPVISFHKIPDVKIHRIFPEKDVFETTHDDTWAKIVVCETYLYIPLPLLKVM